MSLPIHLLAGLPLAVYKFKPPRLNTDISGEMVLLSWAMFIGAVFLLAKFVWKPVLAALTRREYLIRSSLAQADSARAFAAKTTAQQKTLIDEANGAARKIQEDAVVQARLLQATLEAAARADAESIRVEALKDIERARLKAVDALRAETAALAAEMARKILAEELAADKGRDFTDRMIASIP